MPVVGHVPRHVPVRHASGQMLEHVTKREPARHMLDRHVPEQVLPRHVLGQVLRLRRKKFGQNFFYSKIFQNSMRHSVVWYKQGKSRRWWEVEQLKNGGSM